MKIKLITTSIKSKKAADLIIKKLLTMNLSPCIQLIPEVHSTYKWKDKIRNSNEYLLFIKTTEKCVNDCKNLILKYHNYDTPEILVSNAEILNNSYSNWFIGNIDS